MMKQQIQTLVGYSNSEKLKKFKKVILFVFIGLVVLDIVFVSIPQFPSISRVIYNSSPKYIVLIWLFGLFISNVFLQRKMTHNQHLKKYFFLLTIITFLFISLGFGITKSEKIDCENYLTQIEKQEIEHVTRILCREYDENGVHYTNRDCQSLDCNNRVEFILDLTNLMKLLILVFGVACGYAFWPKEIEAT